MSEKNEDEDLLAEIDQWGDMFDALHEGDDALTGAVSYTHLTLPTN